MPLVIFVKYKRYLLYKILNLKQKADLNLSPLFDIFLLFLFGLIL